MFPSLQNIWRDTSRINVYRDETNFISVDINMWDWSNISWVINSGV